MSVAKKYFYLKLKDNFFDTDEMIVLESMPDGYKYSNILLKLYLRSIKHEGRLMFNDRIPFNSVMISNVTRHSVGDIEKAVQIFKDLNLIEVLDNGAIYMLDIQNFIGKSTTEADRIREYRTKLNNEKGALAQKLYICTPDIDIDLDQNLDQDLDLDTDKGAKAPVAIAPVPKRFVKPTIEELQAEINEKGYSVDAEQFYHHYEANGWKIGGKSPMKSWKSALVTWNKNSFGKKTTGNARLDGMVKDNQLSIHGATTLANMQEVFGGLND